MNVVELKEKKISELTHLAKDFNIEGASFTGKGHWRFCRMALGFYGRPIIIICRVQTIFMCLLLRYGDLI